ncbi:MAG TPA: hypothetical protein VFP87_15100 [Chitinophagaceae bacterium]|nr:hypothetical protein [Chitinophagaceae bacterium]
MPDHTSIDEIYFELTYVVKKRTRLQLPSGVTAMLQKINKMKLYNNFHTYEAHVLQLK